MVKRSGFSLIELMIATALGMLVVMIVGFAFNNSARATRRAMAAVDFSVQAQALLTVLEDDLSAMTLTGGFNSVTNANSITFSKCSSLYSETSGYVTTDSDLTPTYDDVYWVRWDWSSVEGPLYRFENNDDTTYPLTDAGASVASVLDPSDSSATSATKALWSTVLPSVISFKLKLYSDVGMTSEIPAGSAVSFITCNGDSGGVTVPKMAYVSFVLSNMSEDEISKMSTSLDEDGVIEYAQELGKVAAHFQHVIQLPGE